MVLAPASHASQNGEPSFPSGIEREATVPRRQDALLQLWAKNRYGLFQSLRTYGANWEVSFRVLPRLKQSFGFIEGRVSFTVSKARVRAGVEQELYELRGVHDDAAGDYAMEHGIAMVIAPVWIRAVFKQDARDIG